MGAHTVHRVHVRAIYTLSPFNTLIWAWAYHITSWWALANKDLQLVLHLASMRGMTSAIWIWMRYIHCNKIAPLKGPMSCCRGHCWSSHTTGASEHRTTWTHHTCIPAMLRRSRLGGLADYKSEAPSTRGHRKNTLEWLHDFLHRLVLVRLNNGFLSPLMHAQLSPLCVFHCLRTHYAQSKTLWNLQYTVLIRKNSFSTNSKK